MIKRRTVEEEEETKPKGKTICFSFATYAANILERLKASNVVIEEGLSDAEFAILESKLGVRFPPDLRAILQQGLPISNGFPNWRSSSSQQLQILLNLPSLSLLRRVSRTRFWHASWGPTPRDPVHALRRLLREAPTLVPIYHHCYIPSSPNVAGNPVFYADPHGHVRLLSYDVVGFFREILAWQAEEPVWAATSARRVRFWSDVADEWWWRGKGELSGCLDGVVFRLREGGWREEEIREMMTLEEEEEEKKKKKKKKKKKLPLQETETLAWHVRVSSSILLRAGWSREDVMYSLGDEGKTWLEFNQPSQ